jgi:hypothetical protein
MNRFITIIASLLMLFSCEEVITINLNSANPVVVVEGNIVANHVCTLKLSYTSDYFNNEAPKLIENAVVTLSDSKGESEILTSKGNGIYSGKSILGDFNTQYKMDIKIGEEDFTGTSYLPSPVSFKRLFFEESTAERFNPQNNKTTYGMNLWINDDIKSSNYYILTIRKNSQTGDGRYLLFENSYLTKIGLISYTPGRRSFDLGDTVNVKIFSVDQETYLYYTQLNDVSGGRMGESSTPYNPKSNFGANVMGYFMAQSIADTTVIVSLK